MMEGKSKTGLAQQIDENLRKVYQQVAEEKVPDRFMDLLNRLKEQEQTK